MRNDPAAIHPEGLYPNTTDESDEVVYDFSGYIQLLFQADGTIKTVDWLVLGPKKGIVVLQLTSTKNEQVEVRRVKSGIVPQYEVVELYVYTSHMTEQHRLNLDDD